MTLKKLNKLGKLFNTIHTGFYVYICYQEKWTEGIYHGKQTEFFVSSLGRVYNKNKNIMEPIYENDSGYLY